MDNICHGWLLPFLCRWNTLYLHHLSCLLLEIAPDSALFRLFIVGCMALATLLLRLCSIAEEPGQHPCLTFAAFFV
ncbi:hypothetical protein HMPREF3034_01632 [Prevotella sp. DNF00663]|nr:hypothetical protein HMPREF3034_01632 [Prevotella sp. DNF00663]